MHIQYIVGANVSMDDFHSQYHHHHHHHFAILTHWDNLLCTQDEIQKLSVIFDRYRRLVHDTKRFRKYLANRCTRKRSTAKPSRFHTDPKWVPQTKNATAFSNDHFDDVRNPRDGANTNNKHHDRNRQ